MAKVSKGMIPEGVEEIEDGVFRNIRTLCDFKFPSTLKKLAGKLLQAVFLSMGLHFRKI